MWMWLLTASLSYSLLGTFVQHGYWKSVKGKSSFTSAHVHNVSTAWYLLCIIISKARHCDCCQVTNCTPLATKSARLSKYKREAETVSVLKIVANTYDTFPRNSDVKLVDQCSESMGVHRWDTKHIHFRLTQCCMTDKLLWVTVWLLYADYCAPPVACARPVLAIATCYFIWVCKSQICKETQSIY